MPPITIAATLRLATCSGSVRRIPASLVRISRGLPGSL